MLYGCAKYKTNGTWNLSSLCSCLFESWKFRVFLYVFNKLSKYDIEHYISLHNPMDKSGSYGIQDWSAVFVKKINGSYNNVIGFPLSKFYKLCVKNKINKFKNERRRK